MHYKKLTIDNFLCFENFSIAFPSGVSVIIGKNGAGKSSLLHAMVYSLYFMFTTDRSMGDDFLSAGNPDLKMRSIAYEEFHRKNSNDEVAPFANFHGEMLYGSSEIPWDMYRRSTSGSALNPSKYKNAYREFIDVWRGGNTLPLIAYFSDSFPHNLTTFSSFAKKQMASNGSTLTNFGYYQWDNETACIEIWLRRLLNSMIKVNQLKDATDSFTVGEVEMVSEKLISFSRRINDVCDDSFTIEKLFYLHDENQLPQLWLQLKEGKEILFDELPAGYKRLYSIVVDLSYRSYLLNRSKKEPKGLVMIDEIDLHLHPSLEMEVVDRFVRVFPELQFVMTSHSPLVVSNIKSSDNKNRVFRLVAGEDKPHELPDLYGVDYDDILRDYMESRNVSEQIELIKTSYIRAKKMGNTSLMKQRMAELIELAGKESAETLITSWH